MEENQNMEDEKTEVEKTEDEKTAETKTEAGVNKDAENAMPSQGTIFFGVQNRCKQTVPI
jgi:uncharacterized ferredoxin-like protein